MRKRKLGKKLSLNKETLHHLEVSKLREAQGGVQEGAEPLPSAASDCFWGTCGAGSCLSVCSLNCSWVCN
jgi:hypothetical protein